MAKQQYLVQKYVMASSAEEAARKSKKLPIHEVYIHGSWFEKVSNYEFNPQPERSIKGFKKK